jgi:DNA-binding LytR/AlgR family response regulator
MIKHKILIIEDDAFISEQLAMIITELGYDVTDITDDAKSAITSLMSNPPDMAIVDIKMHGELQGFKVAEFINSDVKIPFIFLTSFSDESIVNEAATHLPSAYLLKPFSKKEIFSTLKVVLRRKDLTIDKALIKSGYGTKYISPNDILYLKSDDKYVEVHTKKETIIYRGKLTELIEELHFERIVQVHRSYAVNLSEVTEFMPTCLIIADEAIPTSKKFDEIVKEYITKHSI